MIKRHATEDERNRLRRKDEQEKARLRLKGIRESVIGTEGLNGEDENLDADSFLETTISRKRVRKTAAQLREGKEEISPTSIPKDERKTDEELIMLGLKNIKKIKP